MKGEAANRSGLRAATKELIVGFYRIPIDGDVIVQLDDVAVGSLRDVRDFLSEKKVGDSVRVQFYRNKKLETVTIVLRESSERRIPDPPA
jgi:S1-C subfamily serine protease